ncbi:MAG: hypothetical protein AABX03_02435 [Nanoarchaeota archaeon]
MESGRSCLESTIKKLTSNLPQGYEMLAIAYGIVIYPQIWAVQQTYNVINKFKV